MQSTLPFNKVKNKLDGLKKINRKSNKEFEVFFISVLPYMLSAKGMKFIMKNDTNKEFFIKKIEKTFHYIGNHHKKNTSAGKLKKKKSPNHERKFKTMREEDDSI